MAEKKKKQQKYEKCQITHHLTKS